MRRGWNLVKSHFYKGNYSIFQKAAIQPNFWEDDRQNKPVKYFTNAERKDYQLIIVNSTIYKSDGKTLFDSHNKMHVGIYATNILYVLTDAYDFHYAFKALPDDPYRIQHSSMLAGEPVLCAGYMEIREGKLISINNCSGHYDNPPPEALFKVIAELRKKGISPETYSVKFFKKDNTLPEYFSSAAEFLDKIPYPTAKATFSLKF